MNQVVSVESGPSRGLVDTLANKYGLTTEKFQSTVLASCSPKGRNAVNLSETEFYTLLIAAQKYSLNPLMREIYAFPAKGGGIQVIVGVDGWMNMINSHPQFDGMEFEDMREDGKVIAVTCRMFRKDRSHPIEVTEYLEECRRNTDVWRQWPIRMLRHKAAIQAARYAFGFSGIADPDEAERVFVTTPTNDLSTDLAARKKQTSSKEGFNADRIEHDLSQGQNKPEELIDVEPKQDTKEQQEGTGQASETQEATANLTEGQLDLLNGIEEALSGCRTSADVDAVLQEYGQDVLETGEPFQAEANKAVFKRRAELESEQK